VTRAGFTVVTDKGIIPPKEKSKLSETDKNEVQGDYKRND
jgi:hypothetical protein